MAPWKFDIFLHFRPFSSGRQIKKTKNLIQLQIFRIFFAFEISSEKMRTTILPLRQGNKCTLYVHNITSIDIRTVKKSPVSRIDPTFFEPVVLLLLPGRVSSSSLPELTGRSDLATAGVLLHREEPAYVS